MFLRGVNAERDDRPGQAGVWYHFAHLDFTCHTEDLGEICRCNVGARIGAVQLLTSKKIIFEVCLIHTQDWYAKLMTNAAFLYQKALCILQARGRIAAGERTSTPMSGGLSNVAHFPDV